MDFVEMIGMKEIVSDGTNSTILVIVDACWLVFEVVMTIPSLDDLKHVEQDAYQMEDVIQDPFVEGILID